MNPRVKKVCAKDNYFLEIEFVNDETKIFDVKPYLQYPIYQELKNPLIFAQAKASLGTVVWNDEIDFCPDTLYVEGK